MNIERGKSEMIESELGDVLTCVGIPMVKLEQDRTIVPIMRRTKTGAVFFLPGGMVKVSAVDGVVTYHLARKQKPKPAPVVEATPADMAVYQSIADNYVQPEKPQPAIIAEPPPKKKRSRLRKAVDKLSELLHIGKNGD